MVAIFAIGVGDVHEGLAGAVEFAVLEPLLGVGRGRRVVAIAAEFGAAAEQEDEGDDGKKAAQGAARRVHEKVRPECARMIAEARGG